MNEVITLIGSAGERDVFCRLASIGQREYYEAQAVDVYPECKFILADYLEYETSGCLSMTASVTMCCVPTGTVRSWRSRSRVRLRRRAVSMDKSIQVGNLPAALFDALTVYAQDVIDRINDVGEQASDKLRRITRATAPRSKRKDSSFYKNIAVKAEDAGNGMKRYIWYVKAPDHRLTHLLVHGHATRNGGRTKANPFLKNALDAVLPEYERAVEEAVKEAGQSD